MPAINKLTDGEIQDSRQAFAATGYFVLRNVVSPQRLAELHEALAQEFDSASRSGALFSGGGLVSGHLNCFRVWRAVCLRHSAGMRRH